MVITKRMTWDEIRARYPDQWVVMVDHGWPGDGAAATTARVLASGAARADALHRARSALESYECYGCSFTGEPPRAVARPRRLHAGAPESLTARTSVEISGAVSLGERMTWKEICDRYPERWVIMVDHDWQAHNATEFKTARVLATGATRAEAKAHARPVLETYRAWGCHFTGPVRETFIGHRPWLVVP